MKPKKSLGQNFLTSPTIVGDIINAGKVLASDTVLEIGPGKGALTKALLATGAKVIAIEKDDELVIELGNIFNDEIENGQLKIVHNDIQNLSTKNFSEIGIVKEKYKLIANIPYYITGEIIRAFLSGYQGSNKETLDCQPELMVLLVQKEVAERIAGERQKDGKPKALKENLLSLSVKAYGTPKYIQTVKAGSFFPKPNVDSAIILIENISKNFFNKSKKEEDDFFRTIHAGFAHKRKIAISNLYHTSEVGDLAKKTNLESFFEQNKIPLKARPEDINLKEWQKISQFYIIHTT